MLYKQIAENKRKTWLLVLLFSAIVLAAGWAIGYLMNGDALSGIIIAAIILAFYLPFTFMTANAQVLSMSGAVEARREDYPQLYALVEELSLAARLPMPKVYVINDPSPNAFATGMKPEKGVVAFTTGLLEKLNREELAGVVAHELAHIRNNDIRLMTVCIALVSVIVLLTHFGSRMLFFRGGNRRENNNPALIIIALVLVILAPLVAQFVRLAVSRNREYLADATAVEFTRNPTGLINALAKISSDPQDVLHAKEATASMYIVQPLNKQKKSRNWWSTHPPISSRIERLAKM